MEDNKRLILGTTVSDEDAVKSDTGSSQTLNTSTPAGVQNTAPLDVSLLTDGTVADYRDSTDTDDDLLILPASICIIDDNIVSVSLVTCLASNKWAAVEFNGRFNPQFAMSSRLRSKDDYLTVVDMLGHQQPGVHHLLKEGGSGFITYENGNRILIL
jgi:hypothetical protein